MLFPLIKAYTVKKQFPLYIPFAVKSKFIDLEFKQYSNYTDSCLDYPPLVDNSSSYKSLVSLWYLVFVVRAVNISPPASKIAVFPYRRTRTKLFAKYQDIYDLSLSKHFYSTVVDHRDLFYCLTISTLSIDRLYLILSLYSSKNSNKTYPRRGSAVTPKKRGRPKKTKTVEEKARLYVHLISTNFQPSRSHFLFFYCVTPLIGGCNTTVKVRT